MDPKLCADPCRLTGLSTRKELNEHVVDRIEALASGRVKVLLLSTGTGMSVPSASLVPIPEVQDLRLSRRDASPAVLRRLLEAALLGASERKGLDVSDLVESVLRCLVLPVVDAARVRLLDRLALAPALTSAPTLTLIRSTTSTPTLTLCQVRSTAASSSCEHGPCHHSHLLDPSSSNWWISETQVCRTAPQPQGLAAPISPATHTGGPCLGQPETRGRGEWVEFALGEAPVIVDFFHMTIPPLPGGPLSVRTFHLQVPLSRSKPSAAHMHMHMHMHIHMRTHMRMQ